MWFLDFTNSFQTTHASPQFADKNACKITDVRKMFRDHKRFYTGEINKVGSTRIATLGTDSAIGKKTTAVTIVNELRKRNRTADMIYTGQTGWMQGWPHGAVIDALINDFVSGGIEGAILDSWRDEKPEFMLIEGQGSLGTRFFQVDSKLWRLSTNSRLHVAGCSWSPIS